MNKPAEPKLEVLPPELPSAVGKPVKLDAASSAAEVPTGKFRLHPVSGLLIILIDTLFFGGTVISGGWALPLVCLLAFGVTSLGVFLSQKFLSGDRFGTSFAKGFISGVLAGVPMPIAGTVFGSFVLVSAGLTSLNKKKLNP